MKIAVTGHRPERLKGKENEISKWIYDTLVSLNTRESIEVAYNGVAAGADQIFAITCIQLDIPIVNVFPYKRNHYHPREEYIMEHGKNINFQDTYSRDSYYKRDCYMVDNCDILIGIWDRKPGGGTYITLEYAKQQDKQIILIPEEILK